MAMKEKKPGDHIILRLKNNESPLIIDWINHQSNLSDAIRFLIEEEIKAHSIRDLQEYIPAKRKPLESKVVSDDPETGNTDRQPFEQAQKPEPQPEQEKDFKKESEKEIEIEQASGSESREEPNKPEARQGSEGPDEQEEKERLIEREDPKQPEGPEQPEEQAQPQAGAPVEDTHSESNPEPEPEQEPEEEKDEYSDDIIEHWMNI